MHSPRTRRGAQSLSNKPARIAAWRKALAEEGIALVVTAVTATPLWDVKSKAQVGLAKRACTVLGLEVGEARRPLSC